MDYIGPLLLQVILISLNAIFAAAEIAVVSTSTAKIEKFAEDGNKKAKRLLKLTNNSSKFLSTIQVAITLAGLLGSAFAADSFAAPLTNWFNGLGFMQNAYAQYGFLVPEQVFVILITLVLSFFSIVLGELVPKRIAMKHAEKVALGLSGLLKFVSCIFAPLVWILTVTTNGILRLFGINPHEEEEAASEEELRMMLDTSSEKGEIDSLENEMIQNIFEFDDISISEVCTHRRDVHLLYKEDSIDEWKQMLSQSRHGYYPVCGESADDIVGVLNIKKFFRAECKTVAEAMRIAVEKPYFVPENMKADILFTNMKETRNYFAVVVDEYGGTSGVITIHDLLELLVGDMDDKDEIVVEEIVCLNEETREWKILGSASLERLSEAIGVEFDAEDCDTFGGYICGLLGEIPDDGSQLDLETDDLTINVESVVDHRIESTLVTVKTKHVDDDDENLDEDDDEDNDGDREDKKKRRRKSEKDKSDDEDEASDEE